MEEDTTSKINRSKLAADLLLGTAGTAALGAAAFGVYKLLQWAKDPYSTELWLGILPGKKGILVTKDEDPHCYRVRTGFTWQDDGTADISDLDEPEMEIPLPEESDRLPDDGDAA